LLRGYLRRLHERGERDKWLPAFLLQRPPNRLLREPICVRRWNRRRQVRFDDGDGRILRAGGEEQRE